MTEWDLAEDRNNRERIDRARQAAEDLFKPTRRAEASPPSPAACERAAAEEPARRQPRIFTLPPRIAVSAECEPEPEPKPARRKPATRRPARTIPPSQIGRVRTLTSYGMTAAQVAELYEVTVGEIERIIASPAGQGKSR